MGGSWHIIKFHLSNILFLRPIFKITNILLKPDFWILALLISVFTHTHVITRNWEAKPARIWLVNFFLIDQVFILKKLQPKIHFCFSECKRPLARFVSVLRERIVCFFAHFLHCYLLLFFDNVFSGIFAFARY